MSATVSKLLLLIDQAKVAVDERQRLYRLKLKPSSTDDSDMKDALQRVLKCMADVEAEISAPGVRNRQKVEAGFEAAMKQYNEVLEGLRDDAKIYIEDYKFERNTISNGNGSGSSSSNSNNNGNSSSKSNGNDTAIQDSTGNEAVATVKSVRFKDNLVEEEPEPSFTPYRDEPAGDVSGASGSSSAFPKIKSVSYSDEIHRNSPPAGDLSNKQIHQQQKQVMLEQDSYLSSLADSVHRQRELGITISGELDSQMELLDDVENLLDRSESRMSKAKKRLERFSHKAKEHGDWITILILVVVLIILIVVLK